MPTKSGNLARLLGWEERWETGFSYAPSWYSRASADLRSAQFIRAQACAGYPQRRVQIAKRAVNLPVPVELMCLSRARDNGSYHRKSHVLHIVRRMAGFTLEEIATTMEIHRPDLNRWLLLPTKGAPGLAQLEAAWKLLGVDRRWATTGEHQYAPAWLKPWIDWDVTCRAKGYRKTLEQHQDFMAVFDTQMRDLTTTGYRAWRKALHDVMQSFPARAELSESESILLSDFRKSYRRLQQKFPGNDQPRGATPAPP